MRALPFAGCEAVGNRKRIADSNNSQIGDAVEYAFYFTRAEYYGKSPLVTRPLDRIDHPMTVEDLFIEKSHRAVAIVEQGCSGTIVIDQVEV